MFSCRTQFNFDYSIRFIFLATLSLSLSTIIFIFFFISSKSEYTDRSRNQTSSLYTRLTLYARYTNFPIKCTYSWSECDLNVHSIVDQAAPIATLVHRLIKTVDPHTYSRERTLNKRGALTLRHSEINTSSDRTIFSTRIDGALSDDRRRRLCSTTLSRYTLIRTHYEATNAPRANDLDVHICLSRGTILRKHRKRNREQTLRARFVS